MSTFKSKNTPQENASERTFYHIISERNPATGEQIKIAAKRVVKFRVAKAAKDAILGAKK